MPDPHEPTGRAQLVELSGMEVGDPRREDDGLIVNLVEQLAGDR
jgi:hypothetical protein